MPINAASEDLSPPADPPPSRIQRPALFLDLDGVLAPIASTPCAVAPSARRTRLLLSLQKRLGGRVAVLSGRSIAEVDRICEGAILHVSGIHGLERRGADGKIERAAPAAGVAPAIAALSAFAASRHGLTVEDKGVAVGLHYRKAPEHSAAVLDLAADLAQRHGLALQRGHMIAELKTPGTDKGRALTEFMAQAPFVGATPVMIGDDLTDEHGFAAAAALGGFGILVGGPRETAARYSLADSDAVLNWLDSLRESL